MRHILASCHICTFDSTIVQPIATSSFGVSEGPLFDVQVDKAKRLKDGWKCNAIKRMEAYMDDCLDDMSDENLPTGTAAKFAAATSRDSARKLLGGIFSLDRFQYVFQFVRYLDIAESDDKLKNWCQCKFMCLHSLGFC
ncbi:hypothetical protein E4U60_006153 [Claviceps pazoutovae]|uniref:Uncharacterized protein n=1 Tax=Claviceps pazoutovae TaxID=1649127 RepID=A0A9P7M6Z7_9HYPO|nr:hypothetical protein E4U60_006153 [Claviceps pazoutovae]